MPNSGRNVFAQSLLFPALDTNATTKEQQRAIHKERIYRNFVYKMIDRAHITESELLTICQTNNIPYEQGLLIVFNNYDTGHSQKVVILDYLSLAEIAERFISPISALQYYFVTVYLDIMTFYDDYIDDGKGGNIAVLIPHKQYGVIPPFIASKIYKFLKELNLSAKEARQIYKDSVKTLDVSLRPLGAIRYSWKKLLNEMRKDGIYE